MKKRTLAMVLAAVLILSVAVCAVQVRMPSIYPQLTFSGTTANCTVSIDADNSTDAIYAIIALKQGNSVIRNWSASGYGEIDFRQTASVTSGKTYTLVVTATVAGTAMAPVSTTKTCP